MDKLDRKTLKSVVLGVALVLLSVCSVALFVGSIASNKGYEDMAPTTGTKLMIVAAVFTLAYVGVTLTRFFIDNRIMKFIGLGTGAFVAILDFVLGFVAAFSDLDFGLPFFTVEFGVDIIVLVPLIIAIMAVLDGSFLIDCCRLLAGKKPVEETAEVYEEEYEEEPVEEVTEDVTTEESVEEETEEVTE